MMRLIEKIVFSGFVTAWRFAVSPTKISPLSVKATTLGVVFLPSLFGITLLSPRSYTLTHEFVVPRSIPITFDIVYPFKFCFLCRFSFWVNFAKYSLDSPVPYKRNFRCFPAAIALTQRIAKQKNSAKIRLNATATAPHG